jgi:hypothetical protein
MVRYWWHSLEEDTIEIIPHGNTCSIMEELVSHFFGHSKSAITNTSHWMDGDWIGIFFQWGFSPTQPNPTQPNHP